MKKITIIIFLVVLLTRCTCGMAFAINIDKDALLDNLPESARKQISDIKIGEIYDVDDHLKKIIGGALEKVSSIIKKSISSVIIIFSVSVISAVASSVVENKEISNYINMAGIAAIGASAVSGTSSLVRGALQTVEELHVFSSALMPVLAGANAACGAVSSSAAKYAATTFFSGIATGVIKSAIIPLIYVFLALSAASCVFQNVLGNLSGAVKKIVTWILNTIAIVFTLYITLSGTIASSSDQMAVKLTKATVSGLLPIVGGIISDASEVVVSGADMIKNSVSVFGMIAVCAMCAYPFLRLLLNIFVFKAAAILSSAIAPKAVTDFVDAISHALTLALSAVGLSTVMMFISIVSFMKTVVS